MTSQPDVYIYEINDIILCIKSYKEPATHFNINRGGSRSWQGEGHKQAKWLELIHTEQSALLMCSGKKSYINYNTSVVVGM